MERKTICPFCGASNSTSDLICSVCKEPVDLDPNDFQNVELYATDDGYHSFYSEPTAYHSRYICLNYPSQCSRCLHFDDSYCINGRIDIRFARQEKEGTVRYIYQGRKKKTAPDSPDLSIFRVRALHDMYFDMVTKYKKGEIYNAERNESGEINIYSCGASSVAAIPLALHTPDDRFFVFEEMFEMVSREDDISGVSKKADIK